MKIQLFSTNIFTHNLTRHTPLSHTVFNPHSHPSQASSSPHFFHHHTPHSPYIFHAKIHSLHPHHYASPSTHSHHLSFTFTLPYKKSFLPPPSVEIENHKYLLSIIRFLFFFKRVFSALLQQLLNQDKP